MNATDTIEEALRWFDPPHANESFKYDTRHGRILAAEVRRLREVEKSLRAEIKGHDKELRDAVREAITEERWEARGREREL